jgi:hypothetical protein
MKTIITLPEKLCLLFSLLLLFAFIRKADDPIDKLVTTLQKWTDSVPQEKVYLHMDKPYYALGDTIWFKGYLTIGSRHQLSALSGAMYVDLISEKDSVLRTLKLPVTSGMVVGDFILGDDFKEGSYRLRAYTQWMRNAGPDYFFDHTFTVGDVANNNIITSAGYQYKDIAGKPVLTATLNYADDDGKPLAGKSVHYQIMISQKVAWATTAKTDLQGNIPVKISNENQVDLSGAYITTTLDGSNKNTIRRDFPIKAMLSQSDVQFFPESGMLVSGLPSRVAFKAVGVDGLGVNIKGNVTDNENKEVARLTTLHTGMGSFVLRPEANKTYTANITFEDGTTKTLTLPKAAAEGYVLSVYQPNKDSILVRINTKQPTAPQSVNLIAHTNGETIFAAPVKIEKAITSVWLEKKQFPTGIAQFTLLNSSNEPLNERIAFIRSNDQLQLILKTAKTTYNSKEPIQVDLEAKDSKGKPTFGNFSVAVIDETKVPVDEDNASTIQSNILLTSDLKGYVEKPNYYFNSPTDEVNKALDNLMLTQGYRRFTWKELNNTVNTKPVFAVEGLGATISGRVTTLTDKALPNATVNLVSVKAKIAKSATTDAAGKFKFDGIFLMDSIKFAVQASKGKSNNVKIILDSLPLLTVNKNPNAGDVNTHVSATLKTYLDNGKKEDDVYEKMGQLDKVHRLREVRIKANKIVVPTYATQGMLRIPEEHADRIVVLKDAEHCATLGICLQGLCGNVRFSEYEPGLEPPIISYPYALSMKTSPPQWVPMKIIFDGRLLNNNELNDLFNGIMVDFQDIVKVEVVNTNQALMSMLVGPDIPVLLIYTNRGKLRRFYTPNITNITPKGFNKVREFYSPKYTHLANANKLPDLRTTVYWNPYLKSDASGKTLFNFFNTDGRGTYKVIVEGINADGELGRQIYRYRVE